MGYHLRAAVPGLAPQLKTVEYEALPEDVKIYYERNPNDEYDLQTKGEVIQTNKPKPKLNKTPKLSGFRVKKVHEVTATRWHHVIAVFDNEEFKLNVQSVNGVVIGNATTNLLNTTSYAFRKIPLEIKEQMFDVIRYKLESDMKKAKS